MSYYIETSFQTNGSFSVRNPQALSSTDSAGRFFSDEHLYGTCTIQRRESFDEDKVRAAAETSFTDSGLDFPLGSSPESWSHRKSDAFGKPLALQQPILFEKRLQGLTTKGKEGQVKSLPATKPKEKADIPKPDLGCQWTFDEKITLLEAGLKLRQQERFLEPMVRSRLTRLSKPQLVAVASERIMKAAGRR